MKLKTRLLTPLFAVLMLGTATSAFADLTCAISTTPAARDVVNGHWENTGDLTFTCTAPNATPTTDASITVFYSGLPITNTTALPTDHFIQIAPGASYGVVLDTTRTDTGTTGVSQTGSLVAITLPAQAVPAPGTFTLRNVVLSLAGGVVSGSSVSTNVNVVSQSGNVVLTGNPVVIISAALPYLSSTTNPPALLAPIVGEAAAPAQFTSAGANPPPSVSCSTANCVNARASFALTVSEDHIDSWRTTAQYYNNGVGVSGTGTSTPLSSTNVVFTFSSMLPGSIISNCVLTPPAGTTWNLTGSGIASSAGTTTLVAELANTSGPTNLTAIETLTLRCGTGTTTPAYLPGGSSGGASTAITVTAGAAPIGTANVPAAIGTNALTGGTPRYASGSTVGPLTVVQFGGNATGQTTMLIPYALANVGSYDTGISIANTTKDPMFGTDVQGAAVDTSGSLTLNFFPGDGSANFSITPSSGFNLVNGAVPSGSSFIGTLSSILKTANNTSPFQGYIIVVTNFTHAHGTAYVYGGGTDPKVNDRLTSATDVLVISNPLTASRNTFGVIPGAEVTTK